MAVNMEIESTLAQYKYLPIDYLPVCDINISSHGKKLYIEAF